MILLKISILLLSIWLVIAARFIKKSMDDLWGCIFVMQEDIHNLEKELYELKRPVS